MVAGLHAAISNAPAPRAIDPALTPGDRMKVRIERMALLMRGAPVILAVSAACAFLTLVLAWSGVDRTVLLVWTGSGLTLAVLHLGLWAHYSRKSGSAHALATFARLQIVAMGLTGALWGALAPIFAAHGMLGSAFLPFVVAGMTAAAVASAGASWRAVLAFNIPALAPFAAAYALADRPFGYAIALIVLLYAGATAWLAFSTQQTIMRSIRLRSRNARLLEILRKEVETARETEKRYRALVEAADDVTIILSPEGRVVYASPSVASALGIEARALLGKTTREIFHPDDYAHFRAVGEKTLARLGEAVHLAHVCMAGGEGGYVPLSGKLTNMLYVPGVEGFVFCGARLDPREHRRLHAAE